MCHSQTSAGAENISDMNNTTNITIPELQNDTLAEMLFNLTRQNIFFFILIYKIKILSNCLTPDACYVVNATTWLGDPSILIPIYSMVMPPLILINLIINTIILIVLSKPVMKSPTNMILKMMTISDILTITPTAPW